MRHELTKRHDVAGWVGTVVMVALLGMAPSVTAAVANGEVLIGTEASGPDLVRSRVPSRPLLVVVDSPYEIFNEAGTFLHVAAWTADGHPARGADVYLSGHPVGRTDETGTLVFRWGVRGSGETWWERGGDVAVRWDDGGVLHGGDVEFNALPRTGSFASDHVFVYTDRGVYNPGDSVHVRALVWHLAADYSPVEGEAIEFVLSNAEGRPVAAGVGETNAYGVTSLDLPVAAVAEEGLYELMATYEDARATARLRVEHFTPPVIRIEHTLGRFLTRDQSSIAFDVTLGTFTSAEYEGGEVGIVVRVDGETRHREEREVMGPGPHGFCIETAALDAIRRGLLENDIVEVEIWATDSYGRRDDLTRELRFTRNPYIVIIEKDRDAYSPGDAVELIVRLTDRERQPLRDTEVTLLTSTGRSLTGRSDALGTAQFSLTMPSDGLRVEVLLVDVASAVASAEIPLAGVEPMRSHISDAIVREGEAAHVVVSFPSSFIPAETVVHMDVVDTSGALVQSVLLPIRVTADGYLAEGRFATPSWGSMLLTFFCLGRSLDDAGAVRGGHTALGLLTEGQNLAVHPSRELSITLDGIPDEVAPGGEVAGTVRVVDGQGNPVDAMVGAAVVDQAVISLRSPLEITPMDYFYNPELRVLSTTGSAILTWPVVSRNWGSNRRDVALPPFSYLPGGVVDGVYDGERKVAFAAGDGSEPTTEVDGQGDEALDGYSMVGEYGSARLPAEVAQAPPTITIRTELPETSLWEPFIAAMNGRATLRARMPDAITTQEVALVASDRRGGVGVLRVPVRVSQPLYAQVEVPDSLTVGDAVEARVVVGNHTDRDGTVDVTLLADGLGAEGLGAEGQTQTVEVVAGGTAVVGFRLEGLRPGAHTLVASARAGESQDIVERTVWVRPLGRPELVVQGQRLTRDEPVEMGMAVTDDGQMTEVSLNVAFPTVSAAYAGLDAVRSEVVAGDALSMGGQLLATARLYDYQKRGGANPERLTQLRAALEQGLAYLLSAQRGDGGWGFWWEWSSTPYVTGYCLEVLTALDEAGLSVPTGAMRDAVESLAASRGVDGVWEMSSMAFWEGDTSAVRLGMTAEIFGILAGVPSRARTPVWRRTMEQLGPRFSAYLEDDTPDVSTYAHAVLGLARARRAGVLPADDEQLAWAAERLVGMRDDVHWEPSWFNAYGGTIEATVTALEVFDELGLNDVMAAERRQAVRYLLSTRDEWGGWHNPRGTAAAIRGLLLLDPAGEAGPARVVVSVDGRVVTEVEVDPNDPFLSASSLRQLDLTPHLEPGRAHTVAVSYDGTLEPEVTLTRRHWGDAADQVGREVRVEARMSETTARLDDLVGYELAVESTAGSPRLVQVDVAAPANAEIDPASVEALRERGLIAAAEPTSRGYALTLEVGGHERRALGLLLVARRPGEAVVPVAVATVIGTSGRDAGGLAVARLDAPFVVEGR